MDKDDEFKDTTILEEEHKKALQDVCSERKQNIIQKGMVSLEKIYDLQNHLWGPIKAKTHNSTMSHEEINFGIEKYLKYANLVSLYPYIQAVLRCIQMDIQ